MLVPVGGPPLFRPVTRRCSAARAGCIGVGSAATVGGETAPEWQGGRRHEQNRRVGHRRLASLGIVTACSCSFGNYSTAIYNQPPFFAHTYSRRQTEGVECRRTDSLAQRMSCSRQVSASDDGEARGLPPGTTATGGKFYSRITRLRGCCRRHVFARQADRDE